MISTDPNHPFEKAISVFEAEEFSEQSFVKLAKGLNFLNINAVVYSEDMAWATEMGFRRLIPFAVRVLNEFPASTRSLDTVLLVLSFYLFRFSNNATGLKQVDVV